MTPEALREDTDRLRKDADRREALAWAATPGPWRVHSLSAAHILGADNSIPVRISHPSGTSGHDDLGHVLAHDPPAALAQCERDRLLADCIEAMATCVDLCLLDEDGEDLARKLLARFAAMEAKDG